MEERVDLAGDLLVEQSDVGVRESLGSCVEILDTGVPDAGRRHEQGQFLERGVFGTGVHGGRVYGLGLVKQFWLKGPGVWLVYDGDSTGHVFKIGW